MAGYDLSSKNPFRLMQGRLGVYEKQQFDPNTIDPELQGIENQSVRALQHGGNLQQERMIRDKRRSLDRALWFSYQAAEVMRTDLPNRLPVRALINPNKLKMDYDDKIISIGYEHGYSTGTVFQWFGTGTHWIIYLQDLDELAYFRGDIRRCCYEISWLDDGEVKSTHAAIRGPVETKIDYIQKHGISIDNPNYSLNLILPLNEDTKKQFTRYSKFYLQGDNVCWRIEATDWISTPGILEVTAVEYYTNKTEDDIDKGLVGGLKVKVEDPNDKDIDTNYPSEDIIGDVFIKPNTWYTYRASSNLGLLDWEIDNKYPIEYEVNELDGKEIKLKWSNTYSGQFELNYGATRKIIVVESLF